MSSSFLPTDQPSEGSFDPDASQDLLMNYFPYGVQDPGLNGSSVPPVQQIYINNGIRTYEQALGPSTLSSNEPDSRSPTQTSHEIMAGPRLLSYHGIEANDTSPAYIESVHGDYNDFAPLSENLGSLAIGSSVGHLYPAFNTGNNNDQFHDIHYQTSICQSYNEAQPFNPGMPWYDHALTSTSSDSNLHNSHTPSVTGHSYSTNNSLNQHQLSFAATPVLINQRPYRSHNTSNSYRDLEPKHVRFFMDNGTLGFPAKDALNKEYGRLRNRDQRGVLGQPCGSVSIRIEIDDYPSYTRQIKTMTFNRPPQSIKLEKLVTEVAKSLQLFIQKNKDTNIDRTAEEWKVGPVGDSSESLINIDNVMLVGLDRVSKASWQPIFHLLI